MRRIGTLLAGVLTVVALAACGDTDAAGDAPPPAPDLTTPAGSAPATAYAGTAAALDASTAPTRIAVGADGPVEIPVDPERIVGDLMSLDYMTALGLDANDFIAVFGASFFPADHYLADVLGSERLIDPGFAFEANLEAIAAAEPDLIVAPFDQIDGATGLDLMRQIAPVLVIPTSETREPAVRYGGSASFQDWRTTLRAYGAAFGREPEAEAYIAGTEAELAALREEFAELIDATTVTEMKSTPDFVAINALGSALESGVLGTILLSELGFRAPPQQSETLVDEWGAITLSPENLDLVDGDLLFVETREGSRAHEDSPLWDTLEVVRNGGVVEVGNHWEYGGARAARVVIADIRAALTELAGRR